MVTREKERLGLVPFQESMQRMRWLNFMKSKNPYFTELNILIKKCFKEGPPKTRAKGKSQPLAMTSNRNAFF